MYSFCYAKKVLWDLFIFYIKLLKDIFHGLTIFLSKDLKDFAKLKRYIITILWNIFLSNLIKIEQGKRMLL